MSKEKVYSLKKVTKMVAKVIEDFGGVARVNKKKNRVEFFQPGTGQIFVVKPNKDGYWAFAKKTDFYLDTNVMVMAVEDLLYVEDTEEE